MQEFVFLEIKPVFPVCIRQILVYFRVLYFPFLLSNLHLTLVYESFWGKGDFPKF